MKKIKDLGYMELTIVYVISILFLYLTQDILYGGAVDTLVRNLAIVIVLVPIGTIYTSRKLIDNDANGVHKSKAEKAFDDIKLTLLIVIFLISAVYGLINDIYYLVSWQILAMVIVMIIWAIRKRKRGLANKKTREEVIFGILVLLLMNLITVIYLIIVQPVPVLSAKTELENLGYGEVEYLELQDDNDTVLGKYLFEASTETKEIYFTYDVINKEIKQLQ